MGQKFLATKTKDKAFDIKKRDEYAGFKRAKLGTPKNPAMLIVKSEEKREELRKLCAENGWTERIKVKPDMEEDLRDLERLQQVGITKVNEVNLGRNDTCFCGSGKKYKRCCLEK